MSVPELFKSETSILVKFPLPSSIIRKSLDGLNAALEINSLLGSLSPSPVLEIIPELISIPAPAINEIDGKTTESPDTLK